MAIDLAKMREKHSKLKGGGGGSTDSFWKPQDGTQTIRIVAPSDGDPFMDRHFHYGLGENGRTSVLCPKRNYDESCPVCSFATNLWNEGTDDSKSMARDYFAKMRVFAPVVVRGEEDKGVRLWGFSKTTYENLLNIVLDPEYGDITDPLTGTDIRLDYGKKAGQSFPTTDLRPGRKTSRLLDTDDGIEDLLKGIPDINSTFERRSSEEVGKILEQGLGSEGSSEGKETTKYAASTPTGKNSDSKMANTDAVSEIDDAFNELLA
jgi:hypothetical protein